MALQLDKIGRPKFSKPSRESVAKAAKYDRWLLAEALRSRIDREATKPDPEMEKLRSELFGGEMGRLEELLAHYEIDRLSEHRYFLLATCLANDFVEHFRIGGHRKKRGPGRPRERDATYGISFLMAVEKKAGERGKGIADACLQLSKRGPWEGKKRGTLETRYYEEKARVLNIIRTTSLAHGEYGATLGDLGK